MSSQHGRVVGLPRSNGGVPSWRWSGVYLRIETEGKIAVGDSVSLMPLNSNNN